MRWVAEMVFGSLALLALWVFVRDRRAAAAAAVSCTRMNPIQ